MGIFIRTLVVTLVFCIGYFGWVYFSKEGYSPELDLSDGAKPLLVQDSAPEQEQPQQQAEQNVMQTLEIPFLADDGRIEYVERKAKHKTLYTAMGLLMKGPTEEEKMLGIFTEIPPNTRVISVKKNEADNTVIVNLTKEFGEGGGTQSVQARLEQITKTVALYAGHLPVYLYLDGHKAQYLGGEGIYIEQPINRLMKHP